MEHQEEFVEKVDNNTYKCPECGAPMQYDPESSSLKCDYCGAKTGQRRFGKYWCFPYR